MSKIRYFENFEDIRTETESPLNIVEKDFLIFKFSDISQSRKYMPPYRRGFYQITLIQNFGKSKVVINDKKIELSNDVIFFVRPDQILSWVRDSSVQGYMLYFKDDFINLSSPPLDSSFVFFNPYSKNIIEPKIEEVNTFRKYFSILYNEQNESVMPYGRSILKHQLSVLLYKCQELYDRYILNNSSAKEERLAITYKRYVDDHYQEIKKIGEYAQLMNISANYLSQIIKEQTGDSAKSILDKRIILEAKNMIQYTDMTVSEIAYNLGYNEPTHFSRLFRRYVQKSPKEYRLQHTT